MATFTVLLLVELMAAAGNGNPPASQDARGPDEMVCQKVKVVEVGTERDGTVVVNTPAEIPLDAKFVRIGKTTLTVQPLEDRDKPALDFQTSGLVGNTTSAVHATKSTKSYVDALALDRNTGHLVISRAMAGDTTNPGAKGYVAYFHCSRTQKEPGSPGATGRR